MLTEILYVVEPSFGKTRGLRLTFGRTPEGGALLSFHAARRHGTTYEDADAVEISCAVADEVADLATELRLPLVPEDVSGLDGTTFRLKLSAGMHMSNLEWWSELPIAWSSASDLVRRLNRLFAEVPVHPSLRPVVQRIPASKFNITAYLDECHVLTYAETGFSPLSIHAKQLGVSVEQVEAFTETVNDSQAIGTLQPLAPISAIPRDAIRDSKSMRHMSEHLDEFLQANASSIGATTLICDFGTPSLGAHVVPVIETALQSKAAQALREVFILVRR
ncbi:MAG TPA: hypothetical protein VLI72_04865 [Methylibium sp.]|nr:hypothetical protein [Methylibium sp.]